MNAKRLTPILLAVLMMTCLVSAANCAIAGGHDVETTPASGLRWPPSPDAEKTMLESSDINVILCLKAQCAGYKSCYCCFTLPGLPCWPDQKTCWQECPSHKRL
ncbi:uncharacterized protein LOC100279057 isoform 2 precursor [Zea mays]|uniref:Uncharacterized protein n=1 Tax=Zea mays TaxID=4577 RepID=K7U6U8_MAIZE|nr:uncharacterized protein LOC100279057 precursor 2 precursor [Zea mays]AQK59809.1 hypothetical protein ZEAMMB73_Zm00001d053600 [Zea mays]|eukprot:XP_020407059.1 uncharacterized protein LOC100279057 isoform X1 [Zea mays]